MKLDAEEISQDHVYATGRDIVKIMGILEAFDVRLQEVENPKKTYQEIAKDLGINTVGKKKAVVLQEIKEKENGKKEQGTGLPEDV